MNLVLFHFEACPYCQKVRRYITEKGIAGVIEKDIRLNETYKAELIQLGGKAQVPCLLIDGEPIYESDDIIEFLRDLFS